MCKHVLKLAYIRLIRNNLGFTKNESANFEDIKSLALFMYIYKFVYKYDTVCVE